MEYVKFRIFLEYSKFEKRLKQQRKVLLASHPWEFFKKFKSSRQIKKKDKSSRFSCNSIQRIERSSVDVRVVRWITRRIAQAESKWRKKGKFRGHSHVDAVARVGGWRAKPNVAPGDGQRQGGEQTGALAALRALQAQQPQEEPEFHAVVRAAGKHRLATNSSFVSSFKLLFFLHILFYIIFPFYNSIFVLFFFSLVVRCSLLFVMFLCVAVWLWRFSCFILFHV